MARLTSPRRLFAMVAVTSLTAAGLAAVATPSGAVALQPVSFSVATGSAFTSTPIKADFKLSNPSGNTGSVVAFTIVVPPGVGKVKGAGVTAPGNWRELVLPCGSTPSCSSQVLVFATLPLSTSVLKPGNSPANSLIASIAFTTPSSPTSLPFKMIGIGGGSGLVIFTTTDVPTINVISGDAADFTITAAPTTATSSVAGATQAFTLQSQNVNNVNVPYGPGQVRVELGTDDPLATLAASDNSGQFYSGQFVALPTKYAVLLSLPASSTGTYTLNIRFFKAGPTSITVNDTAKPLVTGTLAFTVLAGLPTSIGLDSIKDASQSPPLPNPAKGQALAASFHLADQYGNPTTLQGTGVTLSAGGPGTLSPQAVADTNPGADPAVLGTVTTTYSNATPPINFQLTLNSSPIALSNPVSSRVDGNGASQTLTPNTPAVLAPTCAVSDNCATAGLPKGANGQVVVSQQLCQPGDLDANGNPVSICGSQANAPVLTLVQGDFTTLVNGEVTDLYTRSAPGHVTLTCPVARCPDTDPGTGEDDFATDQSPEDVQEAIQAYPGWAQSSAAPVDGVAQPWVRLGPCNVPDPAAAPGSAGSYIIPSDQIFCSDHSSYHLDSSGNLSFTIYFLIDPRGGP